MELLRMVRGFFRATKTHHKCSKSSTNGRSFEGKILTALQLYILVNYTIAARLWVR